MLFSLAKTLSLFSIIVTMTAADTKYKSSRAVDFPTLANDVDPSHHQPSFEFTHLSKASPSLLGGDESLTITITAAAAAAANEQPMAHHGPTSTSLENPLTPFDGEDVTTEHPSVKNEPPSSIAFQTSIPTPLMDFESSVEHHADTKNRFLEDTSPTSVVSSEQSDHPSSEPSIEPSQSYEPTVYDPFLSLDVFVESIESSGFMYTFVASVNSNVPPFLVAFGFGDGSTSLSSLDQPGTILQSHAYESPGIYTVRVVVASTTNGDSVVVNIDIEVNETTPTTSNEPSFEPSIEPSSPSEDDDPQTVIPVPDLTPTISNEPSFQQSIQPSESSLTNPPSSVPSTFSPSDSPSFLPSETESNSPSFVPSVSPSINDPPFTPDSLVDQELQQQSRPQWANGLIGIASVCGVLAVVVLTAVVIHKNPASTPEEDDQGQGSAIQPATDEGAGGDSSIPDSSLYIPSQDDVSSLQSVDLLAQYDGEFENGEEGVEIFRNQN